MVILLLIILIKQITDKEQELNDNQTNNSNNNIHITDFYDLVLKKDKYDEDRIKNHIANVLKRKNIKNFIKNRSSLPVALGYLACKYPSLVKTNDPTGVGYLKNVILRSEQNNRGYALSIA